MSRIDPNIALAYKSPQMPDPLDTQTKLLQIKDLMTSGELRKQQLREGSQREDVNAENLKGLRMQNQEAADRKTADDALTAAIQQNHKVGDDGTLTFDDDAIAASVTRAGFPEKATDYMKRRVEIKKLNYETAIQGLNQQSQKTQRLAQIAQSVLNADPSLRAILYGHALDQAKKEELIDPQHLPGISPTYVPGQSDAELQQIADLGSKDSAKDAADRMRDAMQRGLLTAQIGETNERGRREGLTTDAQLLGNAKDQTTWDAALAQVPKARQKNYPTQFSDDARTQALLFGLSPDIRAQLDMGTNAKTPEQLAVIAAGDDLKRAKAANKALGILQQYNINIDAAKSGVLPNGPGGGSGAPPPNGASPTSDAAREAVLSKVNPGMAATVRQLLNYDYPLPTGAAMRSPYVQRLLEVAAEADPSFNASQYNLRYATRKDFTSGDTSKNIKSINTVTQHLDELSKKVDELDNYGGVLTLLNTPANAISSALGRSKVGNFKITRDAVANELESVFRGSGGGSLEGVKSWKDSFNAADSPEKLKAGLTEAATLMAGRMNALEQQYKTGIGRPADFDMWDKKTRDVLKKIGLPDDVMPPQRQVSGAAAPKTGGKTLTEAIIQNGLKMNLGATRAQIIAAAKEQGFTGIDQ